MNLTKNQSTEGGLTMGHCNTIMYQLQTLVPRHHFENLTKQYLGNRYMKSFSCWNQFAIMLYAQAGGKDSLRDLQNTSLAQEPKLYHLGIKSVRRSTLADANQTRDYRIYENLFYKILDHCKSVTPKHIT